VSYQELCAFSSVVSVKCRASDFGCFLGAEAQ
jgi:hypothetical protein